MGALRSRSRHTGQLAYGDSATAATLTVKAIVAVAGGIVRYESVDTCRIIFSVVKDNLVTPTAFGFKQSIICQFE